MLTNSLILLSSWLHFCTETFLTFESLVNVSRSDALLMPHLLLTSSNLPPQPVFSFTVSVLMNAHKHRWHFYRAHERTTVLPTCFPNANLFLDMRSSMFMNPWQISHMHLLAFINARRQLSVCSRTQVNVSHA